MLLVQYRHLQPQSRRGTTSVETGQGSIVTGRKIDTLLITSAMAETKVTKKGLVCLINYIIDFMDDFLFMFIYRIDFMHGFFYVQSC